MVSGFSRKLFWIKSTRLPKGKKIKELFCSHYIFNSDILENYLNKLIPNSKNQEVYLTDIINELIQDKKDINSIVVNDWVRLVGLNTKEDIEWIESQKIN